MHYVSNLNDERMHLNTMFASITLLDSLYNNQMTCHIARCCAIMFIIALELMQCYSYT